jgi:hypothetical protein
MVAMYIRRLGVVAAALAVVTSAAACGSGGGDSASSESSTTVPTIATGTTVPFAGFGQAAGVRCLPVPKGNPGRVSWVPADLPLPDGTIPIDDPGDQGGYHRATMAVPLSLHDLVTYVLSEWPQKGWRLGRGDAENGEAEDSFVRGDEAGGFRARTVYCRATWTEFYLVMKVPGASTSGTAPGQNPSQPGGSTTPLVTTTTR